MLWEMVSKGVWLLKNPLIHFLENGTWEWKPIHRAIYLPVLLLRLCLKQETITIGSVRFCWMWNERGAKIHCDALVSYKHIGAWDPTNNCWTKLIGKAVLKTLGCQWKPTNSLRACVCYEGFGAIPITPFVVLETSLAKQGSHLHFCSWLRIPGCLGVGLGTCVPQHMYLDSPAVQDLRVSAWAPRRRYLSPST